MSEENKEQSAQQDAQPTASSTNNSENPTNENESQSAKSFENQVAAEVAVASVSSETDQPQAVESNEQNAEASTKKTQQPEATQEPQISPEEFLKNFDWVKYEDESNSDGNAEFNAQIDQSLEQLNDSRSLIEGIVVRIADRDVIVDINAKSEGVIPLNEFRYRPSIQAGDMVEVMVDKREDKNGQLVLSHKKARVVKAWKRVNDAHETGEVVNGYVKCRTRGGMIVDVFGIEAFLPGSQIDVKPIKDYDQFVDKTIEFKVIKINHEYKNIVVSHKALIEADIEIQKKEIIGKLEKGQVLEGVVKNITSYGVFIDLGGIDGLVHITDLSWSRINHPSEVLEVEQKLNVVILDFDDEKTRIQLGLKQLTKHPWEMLDENLKVGDKVKGKVVVMADYGAFVEISEGVEGLVHVSEMSWSTHLRSAQDFLSVGDEVEAQILTLDKEERKISLGIKQLNPDPWLKIGEKYPVGTTHEGIVRNYTNFGVFVELEVGIDGLVYISDLSWTKKVKHPSEIVTVGEKINVQVLELDIQARKLNLGHKQTLENPWDKHEETYAIGSVHMATVRDRSDKGLMITFEDGIEAFVPNRFSSNEDGTKINKGEKIEFKVIEFQKEYRRIVGACAASHNGGGNAESKNATQQTRKTAEPVSKSTFGDLGTNLEELKKRMEEGN